MTQAPAAGAGAVALVAVGLATVTVEPCTIVGACTCTTDHVEILRCCTRMRLANSRRKEVNRVGRNGIMYPAQASLQACSVSVTTALLQGACSMHSSLIFWIGDTS